MLLGCWLDENKPPAELLKAPPAVELSSIRNRETRDKRQRQKTTLCWSLLVVPFSVINKLKLILSPAARFEKGSFNRNPVSSDPIAKVKEREKDKKIKRQRDKKIKTKIKTKRKRKRK